MKHLFIVNPAAGQYDHTEEYRAKIHACFAERGLEYEIRVSEKPGDCTAFVREAAASGQEVRVYACGGDGTLNEAVCGAAGAEKLALTHFPGGSGNDFIKIFNEPSAFSSLERLLDAEEALFDLIEVAGAYSLNICSMGIDARIGTEIAKYKRLPLVTGHGAYNISTVVNLLKGVSRHYRVELAGETLDSRFSLIAICSGRFYGGGYQPVPEAMPDDGVLEVLLVPKVSLLKIAGIIGKYKAGRYKEYPEIFRRVSTDRVVIHCDKQEVVNVDGEARWGKDVEIRLSDKKLRFFYPRGLTYK